jgi:hypothetical protein
MNYFPAFLSISQPSPNLFAIDSCLLTCEYHLITVLLLSRFSIKNNKLFNGQTHKNTTTKSQNHTLELKSFKTKTEPRVKLLTYS